MDRENGAIGLMEVFARETGLDPVGDRPRRYLWTDAFAVCTYCGLYQSSGSPGFRHLALRLIDQVHHVLGRYRSDDTRKGWISGLADEAGERHPTIGGLRIGKDLHERGADEPYNEQEEWDRDGQYYHYLTRWMHALATAGKATGDPALTGLAVELARTAQSRFGYLPARGTRKRMYWKMSTDLSRPLVPSMGQHDPLDGLVTCRELQEAAGSGGEPVLAGEIAELAGIGRGLSLATADPLGTGGLLSDACRIARLATPDGPVSADLLAEVMDATLAGLSMVSSGSLTGPARSRLAFRELGLSIGLAGAETLPEHIRGNPALAGQAGPLLAKARALRTFLPLRDAIERFWLDGANREVPSWTGHRDINTVMLATSLAPEGYLG